MSQSKPEWPSLAQVMAAEPILDRNLGQQSLTKVDRQPYLQTHESVSFILHPAAGPSGAEAAALDSPAAASWRRSLPGYMAGWATTMEAGAGAAARSWPPGVSSRWPYTRTPDTETSPVTCFLPELCNPTQRLCRLCSMHVTFSCTLRTSTSVWPSQGAGKVPTNMCKHIVLKLSLRLPWMRRVCSITC